MNTKLYIALFSLAVATAGCSAGVKVGSPASAVEPAGHTLQGGLISFNVDAPWVAAKASVGGTLPSVGFGKPTVEDISPNHSKVTKTKSSTPVAAAAPPADPCSVVVKPDEAPLADIEAIGYASINAQSADDLGQKRLLAARASRLDAYRNLVEQVYGLQFSTDSAMLNTRLGEDSFHARMEGSMCGATIVSIEPLGDDLYETRLRLPGVVAARLRSYGKANTL